MLRRQCRPSSQRFHVALQGRDIARSLWIRVGMLRRAWSSRREPPSRRRHRHRREVLRDWIQRPLAFAAELGQWALRVLEIAPRAAHAAELGSAQVGQPPLLLLQPSCHREERGELGSASDVVCFKWLCENSSITTLDRKGGYRPEAEIGHFRHQAEPTPM